MKKKRRGQTVTVWHRLEPFLLAIVVIAVVVGAFVVQGPYTIQSPQVASVDTPLADDEPAKEPAQVITLDNKPAPTLSTVPIADPGIVWEKEWALGKLPAYQSFEIRSDGKYRINFKADSISQFVLYREFFFDKWKSSREHSISKATTKNGKDCCADSGSFVFDVNTGETGTYYVVFDDARLAPESARPQTAHVTVSKMNR
jgi:hypothetical protein